MHSYQHNIKTFNHATRHLTRVERSLYRDLIELYYDTEQPLPAGDIDRLSRRVLAVTDEEKAAVVFVLGEFFVLTGSVYTHDYCDELIEKFHNSTTAKALAGKASAASRKAKADAKKNSRRTPKEHNLTDDDQMLNGRSSEGQQNPTNQKQETRNKETNEKIKTKSAVAAPKYSEDDYLFAEGMAKAVIKVAPMTKPPDLGRWADHIRLMREVDNLTHSQIAEVFRFANKDDFWKVNILSPQTLRKQFAKLDAKMRNPTNEKRNGSAADRWAIDHEDTSWLTGCADGSGDSFAGEHDIPAFADDLHRLEAGIGG